MLTVNAGTGGSASDGATYGYGSEATIIAIPDVGRHFDSWSGSGVADSTSSSTTVTIDQNRSVAGVHELRPEHAWKACSGFYGQALDGKIYQNDTPVLQLVGGECRSGPQQSSGKKRGDGC